MAEERRIDSPEDYFTLLTPTHRMANASTFWCIERAHAMGVPFLWVPHPGDALIGRARSIEATRVLEGQYPSPYAIFLDSDIVFEPGDLLRLFGHLKAGKELVGGNYVVRSGAQLAHHGKHPNGGVLLDGSLQEVDYLSTGFMGFTRGLLRRMVDELKLPLCHPEDKHFRCYPFFENGAHWYEAREQWIYRSEDWDFCDKARRIGVEPVLDTGIALGHEGWKVWRVADLPAERKTAVAKTPDGKITAMPSTRVAAAISFCGDGQDGAAREGNSSPLVLSARRRR